jgi:hypothetical protein
MQTSPVFRTCPGCGLRLPVSDALADPRFNASPECLEIHGELTGYTVSRRDPAFIHQHLVDAYTAQHVGPQSKPIGAAFALIGLYLALEKGYTGKQVQYLHMLLARRSKQWPTFPRPEGISALTVYDVLQAAPGEARDSILMRWAAAVWEIWAPEHERVRRLFEDTMAD